MKNILIAALLSLAATTASAEYINGQWVDPFWVKLHEVKTLKLLSAVARQQTASYRSNQRKDLAMQTSRWDKTPSIMVEDSTDTLFLDKPHKLRLAGDDEGKKGWRVDNFVLIEVLDQNGAVTARKVVGKLDATDAVLQGGKRISQLQPNSVMFKAKQIDIGPLPVKKPFKLKVTALDYGEFGEVSDVYLIVD